ncbi:response regulator [Pseudorhodoferax soli]|uniref:Chemotaxis protein CheA n=1 Tax=Pseudorhodoferax soli TaxID=545864 RepID=A0A368Y8Y7_9BURK|nr:response regulator [Pseudorhodoferax soli]RCW76662.1 chemosensory pili system protein ChpA (sensor histidine kinase/response regulator) [Pseudorhodoferax soli]
MNETTAPPLSPHDLGPVAWVLEELRRTLDAAAKCLHRYRREADAAGTAFHVPGLQHLLQAGQLLHQCAGALHLVEQPACAALADAMEAAVQRFAEQRTPCTDEAVAQVEQAGLAIVEYLQALLSGKPVAPVELFPQYREVQALAGAERSRPVDLWTPPPADAAPPAPPVQLPAGIEALQPGPALRSRLDQAVLKVVKTADPAAALALHDLALGLAAGSDAPARRSFWQLAAGYFQALALGLVPADLYTKRIASGVLTQYAALARGEAEPAAALLQELLFYCAGAVPPADTGQAGTLAAVRAAHGLGASGTADYAQRRFGRFPPALLAQARKRIAAASETWAAVAGGDAHQLRTAHEQLLPLADALARLHDDSAPLAQALLQAVEAAWRVGGTPPVPPSPALALEVATALLYLDTAYADLDRSGADLRARAAQLAERLALVRQGQAPEPMEGWMEALYHGVSERQTMGSVVAELGRTLAEIEQALDQFFRAPREKGVLGKVVAQLTQLRGVLSVLDLEQAAHAVLRMRETVDGYMADQVDDTAARNTSFERLGSSLGALGFLVGMLGYQRHLAQQLFVYDEAQGLFRLRGGSAADGAAPAAEPPSDTDTDTDTDAELDTGTEFDTDTEVESATDVETEAHADTHADLLQIFTDEAQSVVQSGQAAVQALQAAPDARAPLEQLRRAFHTLKGSARMVQQEGFGAAAWSFEELLNARLDQGHAADAALLQATQQALQDLAGWIADIAAGRDGAHRLAALQAAAAALRAPPLAAESAPSAEALQAPRPDAGDDDDDHFRQVGPLRIALPLYNAFLNDADEWSRQLQTELGEWALQQPLPPAASSPALARALADSAAGVGFDGLAQLADLLARVLGGAPPRATQPVLDAAEEIRRLLHQFAAGFLKPARDGVVQALKALQETAPEGAAFEEEIDNQDALDADLFPVFEDEAAELLPQLSAALRRWQAAQPTPADASARQAVLRALHTLKGSARLAGALRLGALAHRLESAAEQVPDDAPPRQLDPLLAHADRLQQAFDQLRSQVRGLAAPLDEAAVVHAPRPVSGQSVRVRAQLLDQLVSGAGEVLITRARMEARLGELGGALGAMDSGLEQLRQQLRELETQTESQIQARLAQAGDGLDAFDPLEFDRFTRTQELARGMAEAVAELAAAQRQLHRGLQGTQDDLAAQGRQARALQRELLRTRTVPFEAIAERLYGAVRQSAKETGRTVRLDLAGGGIELDRGVLDRLAPVFEHLLRNAVTHGIEDEAARSAAGKPASGAIAISVAHGGNDIAFTITDDGRGLDVPRIQARAATLGLLTGDAPLTPDQAAALVFLPGFTTATAVTAMAGRGIGMDVVRTEVHALGGRIETTSTPGAGTQFKLVLPLTTAATQVVLVRVGQQTFGIPTHLVEAVRRLAPAELAQCYAREQWVEDGEPLAFYWAGALLQCAIARPAARERHASVLLLHSAQQRLALHVDEVLGHQEVVVKNLGPQLARLPGLAGMSVLASGAVLLLYNPVALAAVYGVMARQAQHEHALRNGDGSPAPDPTVAPAPLVLVVDDSVTVRHVTQRLLQRAGWRVALAADGVQALEQLRAERPVLVVTDIEMPQMDGYALTQAIRADEQLADLPIVVISSRTADRHREHALALGVDHYLGKPYAEEELLALVRHHAADAPP